jgi:hypothetical protein
MKRRKKKCGKVCRSTLESGLAYERERRKEKDKLRKQLVGLIETFTQQEGEQYVEETVQAR